MKNYTIKNRSLLSKALATIMVVMATVFGVQAQTGTVPKVTTFYPESPEENPVMVHANTSFYIYFDATVSECNAEVVQNGKVIANLTYVGKAPATALPVKKDMIQALFNNDELQPGIFEIKPVAVTYVNSEGDQVKYEATEGEWRTVTYRYGGESGKVVAETEFSNKTVKSWYPADSDEGVKTITFNKEIKNDFLAVLEYGNGESSNNFARVPVKSTLSADGKSITIDLRGRVHSVNSMVPNAHFVDENGNPVPPPTVISLSISDLYTADGQPVLGMYEDSATGSQLQLTAALYYTYNFRDLTFTTPRITAAKFEGENLLINLSDSQNLISADLVLMGQSGILATVDDINISGSSISVKVPTGVNVNNVLSVEFRKPVYNVDDGVNHSIRPFNINGSAESPEVATIADIKALSNQDKFKLRCNGVKVTYSNPQEGYVFIEDESGAVQVDPSSNFFPTEGTVLTGVLEGSYYGEGLIAINTATSEYLENPATITPMELTLGDITFPVNNYRLVTISLEDVDVVYSEEDNLYLLTIDNLDTPVMVVINLIEESFQAPAQIKQVTGIVYNQPFTGYMIVARHKEDIQGDTSLIETVIGDGTTVEAPVYTVGGVKVRNAGESIDGLTNGVYIIGGKKVMVK